MKITILLTLLFCHYQIIHAVRLSSGLFVNKSVNNKCGHLEDCKFCTFLKDCSGCFNDPDNCCYSNDLPETILNYQVLKTCSMSNPWRKNHTRRICLRVFGSHHFVDDDDVLVQNQLDRNDERFSENARNIEDLEIEGNIFRRLHAGDATTGIPQIPTLTSTLNVETSTISPTKRPFSTMIDSQTTSTAGLLGFSKLVKAVNDFTLTPQTTQDYTSTTLGLPASGNAIDASTLTPETTQGSTTFGIPASGNAGDASTLTSETTQGSTTFGIPASGNSVDASTLTSETTQGSTTFGIPASGNAGDASTLTSEITQGSTTFGIPASGNAGDASTLTSETTQGSTTFGIPASRNSVDASTLTSETTQGSSSGNAGFTLTSETTQELSTSTQETSTFSQEPSTFTISTGDFSSSENSVETINMTPTTTTLNTLPTNDSSTTSVNGLPMPNFGAANVVSGSAEDAGISSVGPAETTETAEANGETVNARPFIPTTTNTPAIVTTNVPFAEISPECKRRCLDATNGAQKCFKCVLYPNWCCFGKDTGDQTKEPSQYASAKAFCFQISS